MRSPVYTNALFQTRSCQSGAISFIIRRVHEVSSSSTASSCIRSILYEQKILLAVTSPKVLSSRSLLPLLYEVYYSNSRVICHAVFCQHVEAPRTIRIFCSFIRSASYWYIIWHGDLVRRWCEVNDVQQGTLNYCCCATVLVLLLSARRSAVHGIVDVFYGGSVGYGTRISS